MTNDSHKSGSQPLLTVNREQFLDGSHLVKKIKGLGRKPVGFSFSDGQLSVQFPDLTFRADAGVSLMERQGTRSNHLPARLGKGAAAWKWPPTIALDGGKIRISVRSHSCDWEDVG